MKEVLRTNELEIGYSGKALLQPINVQLNEGDMVALAGPNGAGKTTFFKTLSGDLKPLSGEISLFGKPLTDYNPLQRASLFSIVLTEKPDDMFISVFDIVASGRYPYLGLLGRLRDEDLGVVERSLEITNIKHLMNRNFVSLSDGEKQKVMISKALAQNTPIIFMDEPAAFLDYPSKIELMSLMVKLTKEEEKTILFSSHDLDLLLNDADKLWLVAPDKPLAAGIPEDLILEGKIDAYFSCENIHYQTDTGHFEMKRPIKTSIGCASENDPKNLLVRKALKRNGFQVIDSANQEFTIKIVNGQIQLFHHSEVVGSYDNIESLIEKINKL